MGALLCLFYSLVIQTRDLRPIYDNRSLALSKARSLVSLLSLSLSLCLPLFLSFYPPFYLFLFSLPLFFFSVVRFFIRF